MPRTEAVVALSEPADVLLNCEDRFLLHEGAFRSSKTWTCLIKWRERLEQYPGIFLVMARWKDEDLHTKLIPDYRNVCELMGLPEGNWNAEERCYEFWNGSRLYAIPLKSSEKSAEHSKARGFTVAGVYVSQLEEVPEGIAKEWMLRLSQPGYPKQFLADANPVHAGHWIAETWPADNSKPNYRYVSASIWDNAHNLDAADIEAAEAMYPVGHPMRGPKLEGIRGAHTDGTPVYGGCFNQVTHVANGLEPYPLVDIVAGWDFGAKHPAVVFGQFLPWGALWVLGGVMGNNVVLERFAPAVLELAGQWFPNHRILHAGDPAGSHRNSQGVSINAVRALQLAGVELGVKPDSNVLTVRSACIQTVQGYMVRSVRRFDLTHVSATHTEGGKSPIQYAPHLEPAFLLNPRFLIWSEKTVGHVPVLLEAFGAGYIWDDSHRFSTQADGNLRRPTKDGFFEHPMNALEYLVHNFWQARPNEAWLQQTWRQTQREHVRREQGLPTRAQEAALKAAQKDRDPDDIRRGQYREPVGRFAHLRRT